MDLSGIYSGLDNWNNADTSDHNWRNHHLMSLFLVQSCIMSLMFGVDEMMEVGVAAVTDAVGAHADLDAGMLAHEG